MNQAYTKLFERVFAERPDLAPYLEMFQEAAASEENDSNGNNGSNGSYVMEKHGIDLRLRRLSSANRLLNEDLDNAMDELDDLARALGACEECWGENRRCTKCNGRGKPGYNEPDKELFHRLVLPALRRLPWIEVTEK